MQIFFLLWIFLSKLPFQQSSINVVNYEASRLQCMANNCFTDSCKDVKTVTREVHKEKIMQNPSSKGASAIVRCI